MIQWSGNVRAHAESDVGGDNDFLNKIIGGVASRHRRPHSFAVISNRIFPLTNPELWPTFPRLEE